MFISNFDIGAVSVSIIIMFVYNAFFLTTLFLYPTSNAHIAINMRNSKNWIRKHFHLVDTASTTLALHTLRNTILVAIFVGSQAFMFGFNVLGNSRNPVRSAVLSACLFSSFLSWSCVIRSASHLGYLIGSAGYLQQKLETVLADSDTVVNDESFAIKQQFDLILADCEKVLYNLTVYFRYELHNLK